MQCMARDCECEAILVLAAWPAEVISDNETTLRSEAQVCLDHAPDLLPRLVRTVMLMNGLTSPESDAEWRAWAIGMNERSGDREAQEFMAVGQLECDTHGLVDVNSEGECIACLSGFDYQDFPE